MSEPTLEELKQKHAELWRNYQTYNEARDKALVLWCAAGDAVKAELKKRAKAGDQAAVDELLAMM